ncbi:MAG: enhanced serine sensitivity protein SseB C-terminal domain-containing protein [Alphaproteobacteria bacterium]|nr:enhanced serine sensitivity protein SseB C-terminal domain-containing protein [Alphaproteobacteria bacterium]
MTFVPENNLERSLIKAAGDPAHHPQFYRDIVESDFFLVQHGPPPEQSCSTVIKEGSQLDFQNMEFNGKHYIPVYSSLHRLQAALQEDAGYIALNALEFMKLTHGAELLLNPGSDFGKEFSKVEIQSIIDGSIWKPSESYRVEKESNILIGQPANYPHDLADALSRLFETTTEVNRAFLVHFFNPEKDKSAHTLVGIQVSENYEKVLSGAGIVAQGIEIPDPPVDFIQITGHGGVEDYFSEECEPFYQK